MYRIVKVFEKLCSLKFILRFIKYPKFKKQMPISLPLSYQSGEIFVMFQQSLPRNMDISKKNLIEKEYETIVLLYLNTYISSANYPNILITQWAMSLIKLLFLTHSIIINEH